MNPPLPDSGALGRPARPALAARSSIRRLWAALSRRWWRRTRPFIQLSDHLRRDVGLPPLDGRSRSY